MDPPESRGTESGGSLCNPSLSSPTNSSVAQSAPAEVAGSVGEAPSQQSQPPALSQPAGASNVRDTAFTSAQLVPSPLATPSIIVQFLLAEHQERTGHIRATQERVAETLRSFETSLQSLVADYISALARSLSSGTAPAPPAPNAVLVLPISVATPSLVNVQEVLASEKTRLNSQVPLFASSQNKASAALAELQRKETLQCQCALCIALSKIQARWKGIRFRRTVAPMLKQMIVRRRVLQELYDTESSYVKSLEKVVKVFLEPLKQLAASDKPILSSREISMVFSTWELLLGTNRVVLHQLEERGLHVFAPLPNNVSEAERADRRQKLLKAPVQPCVGDVFLRLAPVLKLYTQYINDQHISQEVLKLKADQMKRFLDEQRSKNRLHLDLVDFLIMPVQRIPRYELLLRELLKATPPSHPDHGPLQQALAAVTQVAQGINKKKAEAEGRASVPRIALLVSGYPYNLVEPSRVLLKEGTLDFTRQRGDEYPEPVQLFLFNDILLICRNAAALPPQYSSLLAAPPPVARPYIYLIHFPLASMAVLMDETAKFPNALFLREEIAGLTFYFFAPSEDERDAWQRAITEAILHVGTLQSSGRLPTADSEAAKLLAEFEALSPAPDFTEPLPLDFIPTEGLVIPAVVAVEKGAHRLFLTAGQADGEIKLTRERQRWEVRFLPNNFVTLRSCFGQYLCAERLPSDLYLPGTVTASRSKAGSWEKWMWARNKRGIFALMSAHKRYLGYSGVTLEAREESPLFAFVFLSAFEPRSAAPAAAMLPALALDSLSQSLLGMTLLTSPLTPTPKPPTPAEPAPFISLARLLPVLEEAASLERLVFARADAQLAVLKSEGQGAQAELNKRLKALGKDLMQFSTLRQEAVTMLQGDEALLRFGAAMRDGRKAVENLKKWAESHSNGAVHKQVIDVLAWFLSLALAWEAVQRATV